MCTRPATIHIAIAAALILLGTLAVGCRHKPVVSDGFRLRMSLTEAASPRQIEDMARRSLVQQYQDEDIADAYRIYQITNGPSRLVFAQVGNGPRGLNMFNLYCYEQEREGLWLLRGYVPVNAYYYTNGTDRTLNFQPYHGYVNVVFRGSVIFSILADHAWAQGHVQ
jgi:hypothetical protein